MIDDVHCRNDYTDNDAPGKDDLEMEPPSIFGGEISNTITSEDVSSSSSSSDDDDSSDDEEDTPTKRKKKEIDYGSDSNRDDDDEGLNGDWVLEDESERDEELKDTSRGRVKRRRTLSTAS